MALSSKSKLDTTPEEVGGDQRAEPDVAPISKEIIVGLVGYAGAGCSLTADNLEDAFGRADYTVKRIKLSELIENFLDDVNCPQIPDSGNQGKNKFNRAVILQNAGDKLRDGHGKYAVAALAVKEIRKQRGIGENAGEKRTAFILDSIKHDAEVHFLRKVYERSFRLMAVHCERKLRQERLIKEKYKGADARDIVKHMDRDEDDRDHKHGQHVRDAYHLADFFIDNSQEDRNGAHLAGDLSRFINLVLGKELVRPTPAESGMYYAYAAANQSSCLSRQVGAALLSENGVLVATGANEAPKFGGGMYSEEHQPENRCHMWPWTDPTANGGTEEPFIGCHNQRRKKELRDEIGAWLAEEVAPQIAEALHSDVGPLDSVGKETRQNTQKTIENFFQTGGETLKGLPGVKDLIEFSRSIHAEMSALFNAARSGTLPERGKLFCTTYPCHNCARHLITAGVAEVQYIEPYVKSQAHQLHYDAIKLEPYEKNEVHRNRMLLIPFTGVGPRMYEDYFKMKPNAKLKDDDSGRYIKPDGDVPDISVRLPNLSDVEKQVAELFGGD